MYLQWKHDFLFFVCSCLSDDGIQFKVHFYFSFDCWRSFHSVCAFLFLFFRSFRHIQLCCVSIYRKFNVNPISFQFVAHLFLFLLLFSSSSHSIYCILYSHKTRNKFYRLTHGFFIGISLSLYIYLSFIILVLYMYAVTALMVLLLRILDANRNNVDAKFRYKFMSRFVFFCLAFSLHTFCCHRINTVAIEFILPLCFSQFYCCFLFFCCHFCCWLLVQMHCFASSAFNFNVLNCKPWFLIKNVNSVGRI